MTSRSLRTFLPLTLAGLALGISPLGCGDDKPKGGSAGTGGVILPGTGGRGGSGGTPAGTGGATGGGGGAVTTGGAGGAPVAGAGGAAGGGASGQGGGGAGGTAGAGGQAAGGAAGADAPVVVDMAPPPVDLPPPPPDLPPANTTINVSTCSQINCPRLVEVISPCVAYETTCQHNVTMELPQRHTSYCHSNGVKKFAKTTYASTGTSYTTIMEVLRSGGAACYTLEIRGTGGGTTDVQSWTYKSPGGEELGTAVWRAADETLTITCGGVNYKIGDVGCPGTDGQPNDEGGDCNAGSCSR